MYHLSEDDDDDILLYGWCHPKERKGQTTNSIELLDKSQATHHLRGRFPNAKEDCWYKQCIPRTISFMTVPKLTPECQGKAVLCIIWIERISKHFCVWDYAYDRFKHRIPRQHISSILLAVLLCSNVLQISHAYVSAWTSVKLCASLCNLITCFTAIL